MHSFSCNITLTKIIKMLININNNKDKTIEWKKLP